MIEAIGDIGEYAVENEGKSIDDPLDILVDDPANRYTTGILFIALKKGINGFEYNGIELEEYSRGKLGKYLYKKGAPNGTDITPTAMITTVEKTFNKIKILPWFKNYNTIGLDEDINFLVKAGNCLRENKEIILKDLNERNSKENNIISLKINNKYLGDYPIFGDILVNKAKEGFYFTKSFLGKNKYSKSENQICSVCNKTAEVYGFVNTFNFYTVDKPGFVSGGFAQKDAWKNYPVCLNCALALEAGKKYLGSSMNFNFYGFKYLLIPQFVTGVKKETIKETFKIIEQQQDPKFRRNEIKHLTADEDEILEEMSKQKNYLNLNLMFYDAPKGYNGSEFKILLYIEDILPSRLRILFDAKGKVDEIDIFRECKIPIYSKEKKKGKREQIGEKPLEFNFGILPFRFQYGNRLIAEREIKDNKEVYKFQENRVVEHRKYFLDIVNKIFTDKPIDYNFLMNFIMRKIRDDFINGYPTKISTLKGFMLLNYLNNLGIIKLKERAEMNNKEAEENLEIFEGVASGERKEISQKISSFFSRFGDFFDSDAKKAIFLEGVLVQKLLNIQRLPEVSNAQPGKEPFRPRLKGLNLDEKQIKKLLPEIQNKLEEYGKNYYRTLESIISKYFVSAGDGWKMSNGEISFYFVLGMNLSYLFKTKKEDSNGGKKNE